MDSNSAPNHKEDRVSVRSLWSPQCSHRPLTSASTRVLKNKHTVQPIYLQRVKLHKNRLSLEKNSVTSFGDNCCCCEKWPPISPLNAQWSMDSRTDCAQGTVTETEMGKDTCMHYTLGHPRASQEVKGVCAAQSRVASVECRLAKKWNDCICCGEMSQIPKSLSLLPSLRPCQVGKPKWKVKLETVLNISSSPLCSSLNLSPMHSARLPKAVHLPPLQAKSCTAILRRDHLYMREQ